MNWQILEPSLKPESVSGSIEYIKGALEYAKKKSLKLDGIYDNPESCEAGLVQKEIRLSTRSLMHRFCAMEHWNASGVEQRDVENALETLSEAIIMFGNHPFSSVLFGRQVYVATEANKAGLGIPTKYSSLVGKHLQSWQEPSWNYSSPRDFKKKEDIERGLPPEWRR